MKIGIFGDSWAYSSFRKLPKMQEELNGVTFQKLFAQSKFSVQNHAKLAGTNIDTLNSIAQNPQFDFYIVFQTDPIRQCIDDNLHVLPDCKLPVSENFLELCELLLKNFYNELEKVPASVFLIGGCTKLCFKHVPKKIHTLEQSWTELMHPDFEDNYFYWIDPTLSLYNHARKRFSWKCSLSDFFEYEKQIMTKNHIWQTSDDFSWCHAAEPAYKKMFDKILEKLNEINS